MSKNNNFENLNGKTLKPISYYMKWFDKSFYMGMHQHPYIEIMYAFKGSFHLEYMNPKKTSQTLSVVVQTGQFVIIDSMTYHHMVTDIDNENFIYNIEFEIQKPEQNNLFNINNILLVNYAQLIANTSLSNINLSENGLAVLSDTSQVELYMRTLINLLIESKDSIERTCSISCNIILLLTEMSKCANLTTMGSLSYIRKVNGYIQSNFMFKITMDSIAKYVGINKSYLQRQYKKYTGTTILSTVNHLRIQKSTQLLLSTNLPISQIAKQSGFQNVAQFTYEFNNILGVAPSGYRKNHSQSIIDHHYFLYDSNSIPFTSNFSQNIDIDDFAPKRLLPK